MLHEDDAAIVEAGYQPRLRRSLGFFSSFAISFSYMSVLTGIFANYGFVLGKAGAFGYWTWILVAVGHTLTALVFAEMSGRMPLTGCGYNWNSRLVNPAVGWFAGWMALFAYAIGVAAVTATIFPALRSLLGFDLGPAATHGVGIALVLIQALFNIYGVRITAYINLLAVGAEILALVAFGILIAAALAIKGHPDFSLLTT
ncbi:MAG: amino acid permease, partial [Alphaproteobacteria bacterium]|nr:amino acid permease [Alphaproteobacteria bacterium]